MYFYAPISGKSAPFIVRTTLGLIRILTMKVDTRSLYILHSATQFMSCHRSIIIASASASLPIICDAHNDNRARRRHRRRALHISINTHTQTETNSLTKRPHFRVRCCAKAKRNGDRAATETTTTIIAYDIRAPHVKQIYTHTHIQTSYQHIISMILMWRRVGFELCCAVHSFAASFALERSFCILASPVSNCRHKSTTRSRAALLWRMHCMHRTKHAETHSQC